MCGKSALRSYAADARPRIGITITNAPTIPDCIQGSATKPCD